MNFVLIWVEMFMGDIFFVRAYSCFNGPPQYHQPFCFYGKTILLFSFFSKRTNGDKPGS
jgi:hypothetical protein